MTTRLQHMSRSLARLSLFTLVALTMLCYPPGPYSPLAHAQDELPTESFTAYLPVVTNGAAAPDLRFTPDNIELAPGTETSVKVTVDPIADLRGATFELPGVQDGVVSSFQATDDGLSGTLTITASTALEVGDRPLEVQGRSGVDSSKAWVGRLAVKTTGTTSALTLFVDAVKGNDSNAGVLDKPFKTLKKALSVAKLGDTINLAAGSYTKNGSGDVFPLTVPDGVTIVGTLDTNGAKRVFLSPESSAAGTAGLIFAGGATVRDLEMDVFGTALSATTGQVTLSNLNMILNRAALEVKGTAQATFSRSFLFINPVIPVVGVVVVDKGQFTMDGGELQGASTDCASGAESIFARGSAQVTLKGSLKYTNAPGHLLLLTNSSKATVGRILATKTYNTSCNTPVPVIEAINSTQLAVSDATISAQGSGAGVAINYNSSAPLAISRTAIGGFKGTGVKLGNQVTSVKVEQSGIATSAVGIDAEQSINANVVVTDTQFDRNDVGLVGIKIKMRRSKVTNGSIGVMILANGADLGTTSDQGFNTFTGNKLFGVQFNQRFVESSLALPAVGNTWNANVQGADGNGKYAAGTEVSRQDKDIFDKNFSLVKQAGSQAPMKIIL